MTTRLVLQQVRPEEVMTIDTMRRAVIEILELMECRAAVARAGPNSPDSQTGNDTP